MESDMADEGLEERVHRLEQMHPALDKDIKIAALEKEVAILKRALHSAVRSLLEVGGGNERTG